MADKQFDLEFEGYWLEFGKNSVPAKSGVYCVYVCKHNKKTDKISIRDLVYIGESGNVRKRLSDHELQDDWESHLRSSETLCYSYAPVTSAYRERVEAALIFKHQPEVNTEYNNSFPFDKTTITTSSANRELLTKFTVERA